MSPDLDALIEFMRQGDHWERDEGRLDRILAAALPVIRTLSPDVSGLVLYQADSDGLLRPLAFTEPEPPRHLFPQDALALLLASDVQYTLAYPAPEQAGPVLLLGQYDQSITFIELLSADEPDLSETDRGIIHLLCMQLDGHVRRLLARDGSLAVSADPVDMLRGLRDYAAPDAASLLLLSVGWDELTQDLTSLTLESRLNGQSASDQSTDLLAGLEPEQIEALQTESQSNSQEIRCFRTMADWRALSRIMQLVAEPKRPIQAAAFIPFAYDELLRYAIIITYADEMTFSAVQETRFELARRQIAPILEQRGMLQAAIRLNAQLGHQVRILQTAHEVSSQLVTTVEKDQLLKEIGQAFFNVLGVDCAFVMLPDAGGDRLRIASRYPDTENLTEAVTLPMPSTDDAPLTLSLQAGVPDEWRRLLLDHQLAQAQAFPIQAMDSKHHGWVVVGREAGSGAFESSTIELGQALASRVGVIMQKTDLLEDARRQAEQFRYMTEFGMTLNSILEKDELLEVAAAYLMQILNADYVDVALYNPIRGGLYQVAWQTADSSGGVNVNSELRIDTPDSVVQAVWQAREPIQIDDTQQETAVRHHIQEDLRSILALPIVSQGNSLGVIEIGSLKAGHFSAQDITAAQPIIAQLSMSFQNLETYSHGKRLAMAKAVASDISVKLSQQWDVEQIMSVAMSELGRALGAHRGRIRLQSDSMAEVKVDNHGSE